MRVGGANDEQLQQRRDDKETNQWASAHFCADNRPLAAFITSHVSEFRPEISLLSFVRFLLALHRFQNYSLFVSLSLEIDPEQCPQRNVSDCFQVSVEE